MPFRFHIYNFQDQARGEVSRQMLDELEAAGWEPHTVTAEPGQVAILWHRPVGAGPAEDSPESPDSPDGLPRGKQASRNAADGGDDSADHTPAY